MKPAEPEQRGAKVAHWLSECRNGDRFEVKLPDIFGGLSAFARYTYGGRLEQSGYAKGEHGDWALSAAGEEGWRPSYRAKVRRYRAKRWRWLVLDCVQEIKAGWGS